MNIDPTTYRALSRLFTITCTLALAACSSTPRATNENQSPERPAPSPSVPGVLATKGAPPDALFEFIAVDFADARTGWVAGRDLEQNVSAVFGTTDGGATWKKLVELRGGIINDVDFASATDGWFVTSEGNIYRSGDGGRTWSIERESRGTWILQREGPVEIARDPASGSAGITSEFIASLFFLDEKTGWAAGDAPGGPSIADRRGLVLATSDGGATWKDLSNASGAGAPAVINDLWFVSATDGWAAAGNVESDDEIDTLLRTADGGRSWTRVKTGTGQFHRAVHFATPQSGWVVGLTIAGNAGEAYGPSRILATADGGATWSPQVAIDRSLFDIAFADVRNGWAVGDYSVIFATSDGGVTWTQQASFVTEGAQILEQPPAEVPRRPGAEKATGAERDAAFEPRSFLTVSFLTPRLGWAAGARSILRRAS